MARIPAKPEEEDEKNCLHASRHVPCITFTPDDIQVKGNYNMPLCFTGYIRSSEMSCIQVDPRSILSIMPRRIMQHLGIPTHRLSTTQTTVYGFNANGMRPMRKIKFKCQIGDLRFEVTCYVIDTDTSYNLLLRRPWIHHNSIVPSTLHQVMKYVDGDGKVRTFKGVDNYFTDSLLYQDSLEIDENSQPEELDSGNEADVEPEAEEEFLWELNPLVTSVNKLNVNNTVNDVGEWYINEELDLLYFSMFASDSVPSDTSTDVDADLLLAIDALTSLHVLVRSSLTAYQSVSDAQGSFFEVLARCKGQKLILFGRVESKPTTCEDTKNETELSHYESNVLRIMENIGYDLISGLALNFSKGRRTLL